MANLVQMLQRVLLLCVAIMASGVLDSLAQGNACPKHAGLNMEKAKYLHAQLQPLQLSCDQNNAPNIVLANKDFKKMKGKSLCTLLKTYFTLYIGIPRGKFSAHNLAARSQLMNTMNHTISTFESCEVSCGRKKIQSSAKKQIEKIERIKQQEMDENALCELKDLFNHISLMFKKKTSPTTQSRKKTA